MHSVVIREVKSSETETLSYTQIGWILFHVAFRERALKHLFRRMEWGRPGIAGGADRHRYWSYCGSWLHNEPQSPPVMFSSPVTAKLVCQ